MCKETSKGGESETFDVLEDPIILMTQNYYYCVAGLTTSWNLEDKQGKINDLSDITVLEFHINRIVLGLTFEIGARNFDFVLVPAADAKFPCGRRVAVAESLTNSISSVPFVFRISGRVGPKKRRERAKG